MAHPMGRFKNFSSRKLHCLAANCERITGKPEVKPVSLNDLFWRI